jgi:hypothetical protein
LLGLGHIPEVGAELGDAVLGFFFVGFRVGSVAEAFEVGLNDGFPFDDEFEVVPAKSR